MLATLSLSLVLAFPSAGGFPAGNVGSAGDGGQTRSSPCMSSTKEDDWPLRGRLTLGGEPLTALVQLPCRGTTCSTGA